MSTNAWLGVCGLHIALLWVCVLRCGYLLGKMRSTRDSTAELMELKLRANAIAGGEHEHNE